MITRVIYTLLLVEQPHAKDPPMSVDVQAFVIRSLNQELESFDTTLDRTVAVRTTVITKLEAAVQGIEAINTTDPDAAIASLNILNTTLKALSDQEASAVRRVTAKLKYQENARNDATSENVGKLIRALCQSRDGGGDVPMPFMDLDAIAAAMARSLTETGDQIAETELRMDPDDLS